MLLNSWEEMGHLCASIRSRLNLIPDPFHTQPMIGVGSASLMYMCEEGEGRGAKVSMELRDRRGDLEVLQGM